MRVRGSAWLWFAAGVLLMLVALLSAFVAAPRLTVLPGDLDSRTSVTQARNARYVSLGAAGIARKTGTLTTTTVVTGAGESGDDVRWRVEQRTESPDGATLDSINATISLDKNDAAATSTKAKPGPERAWQYVFPFHTDKMAYPVWDNTLGVAVAAQYNRNELISGLGTYRFDQVVPRTPLPVDGPTKAALLGVFAPGADDGQVFYTNARTFWVEPVTGQIVAYREQPRRELVPSDGGTVVLLDATFSYTPDTTAAAVADARDNRRQILAISAYGPLVIGLIGLAGAVFALVLGVVRRRRARRRATAAGALAEEAPEETPEAAPVVVEQRADSEEPAPEEPTRAT